MSGSEPDPRGALRLERDGSLRVRVPFLAAGLLLLLAHGVAQIRWGEHTPIAGGLGTDGVLFYGPLIRGLPGNLFDGSLDLYRAQKVLPSLVVHACLRGLGLPLDARHIRECFALLNLALLLVAFAAWHAIARRSGFSPRGQWLGFLLLFGGFELLRMPFYNPVMTDVTAFTLGLLLLLSYLRSSTLAMLAILALGSFTWASFLGWGSLLFVFPPRPFRSERPPRRHAHTAVGMLLASLVGGWGVLEATLGSTVIRGTGGRIDARPLALALAVLIAGGYLVAISRGLLGRAELFDPASWRQALDRGRLILLAALVVAVTLLVRGLAGQPALHPLWDRARDTVLDALLKPGLFPVAHAVSFGLLPLLICLFWRDVCRAAHAFGFGMTLYAFGHLAFGIHSEARFVVDGVPVLAFLVVSASERLAWPAWGSGLTAAIALLASKLWYTINHGPFRGRDDPLSYPAQYYFLNFGPAMSYRNMLLQGGLALAALLALFLIPRSVRSPEE